MNCLNSLRLRALLGSVLIRRPTRLCTILRSKSTVKKTKTWDVSHRPPLQCVSYPGDPKPCFDLNTITVERGSVCHAKIIRSFLYTHYWPREPTVCGLWMRLDSPYLDVLSDQYAYSGDRLIAYERLQRTNEKKMVGLSVANKIYPWMIDELEEWAHVTCEPDKYRMYFCAHCLKSPNLFEKYNVDYLYNVLCCISTEPFVRESDSHLTNYLQNVFVLGTAQEVAGQGVGVMLLRTAIAYAQELRHPLVQVVAVNKYTARICEKCGMKLEWSMDYTEFVDDAGQRVFFPRRPHHTVSVYVKYFDPKKKIRLPCKPPV